MNLPNPSPDTDRLWTETERTLRGLLGRGGRLAARRNPRPEEAREDILPYPASTARHERALRALAKEIKRLITEDKRRGLGV